MKITAQKAWALRERGLIPFGNQARYENPDVEDICKAYQKLMVELDTLDTELRILAEVEKQKVGQPVSKLET